VISDQRSDVSFQFTDWEHLTFVTPKSGFMSRDFESLARNQF